MRKLRPREVKYISQSQGAKDCTFWDKTLYKIWIYLFIYFALHEVAFLGALKKKTHLIKK